MVHRSRDYNLAIPEDRKLAAEIVVAIATFYIEQEMQITDYIADTETAGSISVESATLGLHA